MTELELLPSAGRRRVAFITAAVIGGLFTLGATAGAGTPGLLIGLAIMAVLLLVMFVHLRQARIEVTGSQIIVHGALVTRRRERSRAASVVRAVVIPVRGPSTDTVFVRDTDDAALLRIHGNNYDRDDLDRLVAHLGLPATGPDRPVTAAQLARQYPRIVPWIERHPFKFAFAVAFGFMALIVAAAAIVSALNL